MSTILAVPLSNQLQSVFIDFRNVYEIRERPSRMYNWTAFLTAHLLVEIPWNNFRSFLFFICWYWTVGFENSRAGYTYLFFGVLFPIYYTTIGQAVASMAPTPAIASLLFSALFSFVIAFNGVLQPGPLLGWWYWMYRTTPFTYLIEGLVGQAVGRHEINCGSTEFVSVQPPSGQTCTQYLQAYISNAGGYLENPDATSDCMYCSARTTDEFLGRNFSMLYDRHLRDLGIFIAYCVFNVRPLLTFYYAVAHLFLS